MEKTVYLCVRKYCLRSSKDRMMVSGTIDVGSIPAGGTKNSVWPYHTEFFYFRLSTAAFNLSRNNLWAKYLCNIGNDYQQRHTVRQLDTRNVKLFDGTKNFTAFTQSEDYAASKTIVYPNILFEIRFYRFLHEKIHSHEVQEGLSIPLSPTAHLQKYFRRCKPF